MSYADCYQTLGVKSWYAGEQANGFDPETRLNMLDAFKGGLEESILRVYTSEVERIAQ